MSARLSFPRATDDPRAMPELRACLLDLAKASGMIHQAEFQKLLIDITGSTDGITRNAKGEIVIVGPNGHAPSELERLITAAHRQADNTSRWYRETLPTSQLIYVSDEMTDFVTSTATAVPAGLALGIEDAPAPAGLVVFAKPVYGTDAGPERPGEEVRIDGIAWGPVRLPAPDVPWHSDDAFGDAAVLGTTIAMFRMVAPEHSDVLAAEMKMERVIWMPLGRTDWPWGDRLDKRPAIDLPNPSSGQWASMMEDRRLLAALWATLNQKRIIDTYDALPTRHAQKRLDRAGHGGRDETIHVIHLRKTEYRVITEGDTDGRHVSVRFPVRPFVRRQPYGPGRSKTKVIVVAAHWRGPEGAPIVHHERIWSLDR